MCLDSVVTTGAGLKETRSVISPVFHLIANY